jgi:hypothetical protein
VRKGESGAGLCFRHGSGIVPIFRGAEKDCADPGARRATPPPRLGVGTRREHFPPVLPQFSVQIWRFGSYRAGFVRPPARCLYADNIAKSIG